MNINRNSIPFFVQPLLAAILAVAAAAQSIVPDGWDPALAGDVVMERLVKVTAPQVRGSHDAEMVLVGDRAYIVAECNDDRSGESAAWPQIYSAMSIVDLKTMAVEMVVPFARGEQVFANETLPVGACFVPRIVQRDAQTLRCFFASESPGKRQSQTWYRDFDIASQKFADTIHRVKLKTAAGLFDMQPQHLHASAVANGFEKRAKDAGLYLFDAFKKFDGKTYVAINNYMAGQLALTTVNDDFDTFEIVGHYHEPQSMQLSESAVNRLPDGSWMAICRHDGGNRNYKFTTSVDGQTWTVAKELPHVSNGTNSKPTFDKFGDTYYLGWQEATRIGGANRSVFNIDVSRDGKTWRRKYRFETPKSFQYPAFHEHDGTIWLCVTQGDSSASRKERIMFGALEKTGQFASQAGLSRKPIAIPAEQPAVMKVGVKLFTDRDYTLIEAPEFLLGRDFLRTSIEGYEVQCKAPGELFVMTLSKPHGANRSDDLKRQGFEKLPTPEFQLFSGDLNRVFAWRKEVNPGDRVKLKKLALMVVGEKTKVERVKPKTEGAAEAAARIKRMEAVADLALVPPTLNTSPLPEYGYDRLDYGMTIGIERTPGGRLWACWVAGGDSPEAYFVLASSDDDGQTWSDPRFVLDSHDPKLPMDRSILVGNLWTDPLGRLWMIFDQSMHMYDGRAGVWAIVCDNPDGDQPQWSQPRRIWHGVTLNKPTVLSDGSWMLPISLDQRPGFGPFKGCFAELEPLRGANVFVSQDQGASWQRRGAARFPNPDWHEHMIVERKDGSLWMLARTAKGIMQTTSTDGGRTWATPSKPPGIAQPNARFHVRRLASGKILLVKHGDRIDTHNGRVQLSAWLSDDEGLSWQGGLVLDERKGISYPDGFQAPDGTIYISYDRNRATDGEILMARFTEADILAKKFVGPKSQPKMLISRPLGLQKKK
ncbi:sialidase family protein [Rosistilla ulvae]|nr:sialidase family protein [Rosistilla ulvae]